MMGETQEALSLATIRAIVARGDPVTAGQVLWLCGRVDELTGNMNALLAMGQGLIPREAIVATLLLPRNTGDLEAYIDAVQSLLRITCSGVHAYYAPLLTHARAWAGAIERQDVAEIERCEHDLIIAIAACSS